MKNKPSDLIAIANSELADRLNREEQKKAQQVEQREEAAEQTDEKPTDASSFKQDVWKAILSLNLMRYALGIGLLLIASLPFVNASWKPISNLVHPTLYLISSVLLLTSAVAFTYMSKVKKLRFSQLLLIQFSTDVILSAMLIHSCGSLDSSLSFLYFIAVATGSVVLPRVQALGLASGTIIVMFYEHIYIGFELSDKIEPNYQSMAQYGIVLLVTAIIISYLAERIRLAELKSFVPGNESIEDFLVREEMNALQAALQKTAGNKTEAAKLLGMTFRSFRYKLTKYDIS